MGEDIPGRGGGEGSDSGVEQTNLSSIVESLSTLNKSIVKQPTSAACSKSGGAKRHMFNRSGFTTKILWLFKCVIHGLIYVFCIVLLQPSPRKSLPTVATDLVT